MDVSEALAAIWEAAAAIMDEVAALRVRLEVES